MAGAVLTARADRPLTPLQVFRQLWLARRKNAAPACPLAALPDSFIKSVISVLVSSEVAQLSAVKKP